MVEKQLDNVLKENTLRHLGITINVPGFNVTIAAFSCIYLIQEREKEIGSSEDPLLQRYTSETLMDELMDLGVTVDDNYNEIISQIQKEDYISINKEDRYYSGKLSLLLINIFNLVYPTMEGLVLVAYFIQTAEEVNSLRKSLEDAIAQVDITLKKKGVSVDINKIPKGYRIGLKKIVSCQYEALEECSANDSAFKTICMERSIKRDKSITEIENSMKEKGEIPVLPLNIKYMKQQMGKTLYSTMDISDTILSDVAMTVNILKLANKEKRKKPVATISHAIMLIGNDPLKKIINELISLDAVADPVIKKELECTFLSSYMSNCITKNYAIKLKMKDTEEMCIYSMIHNMGQLIVLYYYPEAYSKIKEMTLRNVSKRKAAREILGTTYDNIGIYFARQWNLPFTAIESLRVCYFNRIGRTRDNLSVNLPFCSAELCAFSGGGLDSKQKIRLRELINSLNMFSRELGNLLDKAWVDVVIFSKKQKISIIKKELSKIAATG